MWLAGFFLTVAAGLFCRASDYQTQGFPPAHELFPPLQADPTELHFSFQLGAPVSQRGIAKVDVGDYLGIYRWAFLDGRGASAV